MSGNAGCSSRDLREVQDAGFDTMCHMIAELAHELHQAGRLGPPGAAPGESSMLPDAAAAAVHDRDRESGRVDCEPERALMAQHRRHGAGSCSRSERRRGVDAIRAVMPGPRSLRQARALITRVFLASVPTGG